MNWISYGDALRILKDLIALPTVNPMGRPYECTEPVERKVVAYITDLFSRYGIEIVRQACSPIHESLVITIPGRTKGPITLLESHIDTVPADDWSETAFTPRVKNSVVIGRGACDDKGSLTAMILAICDLLESGKLPPYPIVFLAAGDEEYAQTGIKFFARLNYSLGRSVIGEPTRLTPILQHKGTVRWDVTVHGQSAHSSRPEMGRDAIQGAVRVMQLIAKRQRVLCAEFVNPLMSGPTITVTMIRGGRTRNAIADECTLSVDFRVLPGMDPAEARQLLIETLEDDDLTISHSDIQLITPPLCTQPDDPFSLRVLDICHAMTGQKEMTFAGAPYGTDAAWVADRAPAVVLGPGTIDSAHGVDENIDVNEVVRGARIYSEILLSET
jgi:acetylornithine deacetylase